MAITPCNTQIMNEDAFKAGASTVIANGSETKLLFEGDFDVSGSVSAYIEDIKKAAKLTLHDLQNNDITRGSVYILWSFFGTSDGVTLIGPKPVSEVSDEDIDNALKSCGFGTPGEKALAMARAERKKILQQWKDAPCAFYVPLQFLVTDLFFDTFTSGPFAKMLNDRDEHKVNLIPIMTPGFNEDKAKKLYPDGTALMLKEQNATGYAKLFEFIKASVSIVSDSVKGDTVTLPPHNSFGITPITIKA